MTYTRKNVWKLGSAWAPEIYWYAKGVKAMRALPLNDPTSWQFYAAIHGIDSGIWQQFGYLKPTDPQPNHAAIKTYWKQCQHGGWYFLPWHRGYLHAFEAIVRAHVIALGGPADWALPYWNYFGNGEADLPHEFATTTWPDSNDNPLFVARRYGPTGNGNVTVLLTQVNLNALSDPKFIGGSTGASRGFGGIKTGFLHPGQHHGGIESQPHDVVHGLVGGQKSVTDFGLMSDPDTAALDPIFWLHHANIDRLWEVWLKSIVGHANPVDPAWLGGPTTVAQRAFTMPKPDGTAGTFTPADMGDLSKLDYVYDDTAHPLAVTALAARMSLFGLVAPRVSPPAGATAMASGGNVELIGASTTNVQVTGNRTSAPVTLDPPVATKLKASFASIAPTSLPDHVFLNLENVRAKVDGTVLDIYIGVPKGAKPTDHPENRAGSIGLFGVRSASDPNGEHGGSGLTFAIDITEVVDKLHLANLLPTARLDVDIVVPNLLIANADISIGRISVYREEQ
jgi:tyrosinase